MVARVGIEPTTLHFSGVRYYQLSYLAMQIAMTSTVAMHEQETRYRDNL